MNQININSLFCQNDNNQKGTIDIDTLFPATNPLKSSDELVREISKKKRLKFKYYDQMYNSVWNYIIKANKIGDRDTIVHVVEFISNCQDYDSTECLEFISKRLQDQMLETVALDKTSMFVTWHNIEEKKKLGPAK